MTNTQRATTVQTESADRLPYAPNSFARSTGQPAKHINASACHHGCQEGPQNPACLGLSGGLRAQRMRALVLDHDAIHAAELAAYLRSRNLEVNLLLSSPQSALWGSSIGVCRRGWMTADPEVISAKAP